MHLCAGLLADAVFPTPKQSVSTMVNMLKTNAIDLYNEFAMHRGGGKGTGLPIYLWFGRKLHILICFKISPCTHEVCTKAPFMWVKRMFPPCPFNMLSVKFCMLPLGPSTCWRCACNLHSKFSLPFWITMSTIQSAPQWNWVSPPLHMLCTDSQLLLAMKRILRWGRTYLAGPSHLNGFHLDNDRCGSLRILYI